MKKANRIISVSTLLFGVFLSSFTFIQAESNESTNQKIYDNVKEDQYVSGVFPLVVSTSDGVKDGLQVTIDGKKLCNKVDSLKQNATFVFEVNEVGNYFKNAVTMGDDVLQILDTGIKKYQTIKVPVSLEKLSVGDNTIEIRSGDKNTPFLTAENKKSNRDDFTIRNVRLVLADGTILKDESYVDSAKEICVGDGKKKEPYHSFHFQLKEEMLQAHRYEIDTKEWQDGEHVVEITTPNDSKKVSLLVDNKEPNIVSNINENAVCKGKFSIYPIVTDDGSKVKKVTVYLDGKKIKIPYETSSSKLSKGTHTVKIKAKDHAGNQVEKELHFVIPEEQPDIPSNEGVVKDNNRFVIKTVVKDPTNDLLHVSFKKGYLFKSNSAEFQAYKNSCKQEPPSQPSLSNEKLMDKNELALIEQNDGKYVETNSLQFPYQRFEVKVDSSVSNNAEVGMKWRGHSYEGRRVTLYGFEVNKNKWEPLASKIAGKEDFDLTASVKKGDFTNDEKINLMVQDRVEDDNQKFTFAWLSDTQFYSKTYPKIFDSQVNWLIDNQKKENIQYVIHTGDIINDLDDQKQWTVANQALTKLDHANVPYGVLAGNHDVGHKKSDYETFYKYFGKKRFEQNSWYGNSYKNNRGHYDLISVNGVDFIIMYMGWNIGDDEYRWMNETLQTYQDRKAILCFHEYLSTEATRYDVGEGIFQNVVKTNPNVLLVLSGHYHGAANRDDAIDDNGDGKIDRIVHQVLADYQNASEGGQGYLRLLTFDPKTNQVNFRAYSPYKNEWNYFGEKKDELRYSMDLSEMKKQVATDSFQVNVYTNEVLKELDNVSSNQEVSTTVDPKDFNENAGWYIQVKDKYGGENKSEVWKLQLQ